MSSTIRMLLIITLAFGCFSSTMCQHVIHGKEITPQVCSHMNISRGHCLSEFRAFDGACNNRYKQKWGASGQQFFRHINARYDDNIDSPVGTVRKRPNPRAVSQTIFARSESKFDSSNTAMLAFWGVFIAHDMTLSREMEVDCVAKADEKGFCHNIQIPKNDKQLRGKKGSMPFLRTEFCDSQNQKIRQQINAQTSFLDGSQIYGPNDRMGELLRGKDGKLRENNHFRSPSGLGFLPFDENDSEQLCFRNRSKTGIKCFIGGDIRVNENLLLTAIHTIFMREHNRIATLLRNHNPLWLDERIFQETRKIVGAIIQHTTFNDWLPRILGKNIFDSDGLIGPYNNYKPATNPTFANEVATAAMRFGHAFVVPTLFRADAQFNEVGELPLRHAFFVPETVIENENILDDLLRGAIMHPLRSNLPRASVTSELTNHLFPHAHHFPLDLAALNIQRGREHGLPTYNSYRRFCGLPRVKSWKEFYKGFTKSAETEIVKKLSDLYKDPEYLDLWVGGMLERPVRGRKLGPLFSCLLADQFKRIRDGDSFFYENPKVFTKQQLEAIKKYSLGKVICNNIDEPSAIPAQVFDFIPSTVNVFHHRLRRIDMMKSCEQMPDLDLSHWSRHDSEQRRDNNNLLHIIFRQLIQKGVIS